MLNLWKQVSCSLTYSKTKLIFPYSSIKEIILGQTIENKINKIKLLPQIIEIIPQRAFKYNFFEEIEDPLILYNGILECRNIKHEVAKKKAIKRKRKNKISIRWR